MHPRVLKGHHVLRLYDFDASAHSRVDAAFIWKNPQVLKVEAKGIIVVPLAWKFELW